MNLIHSETKNENFDIHSMLCYAGHHHCHNTEVETFRFVLREQVDLINWSMYQRILKDQNSEDGSLIGVPALR